MFKKKNCVLVQYKSEPQLSTTAIFLKNIFNMLSKFPPKRFSSEALIPWTQESGYAYICFRWWDAELDESNFGLLNLVWPSSSRGTTCEYKTINQLCVFYSATGESIEEKSATWYIYEHYFTPDTYSYILTFTFFSVWYLFLGVNSITLKIKTNVIQ